MCCVDLVELCQTRLLLLHGLLQRSDQLVFHCYHLSLLSERNPQQLDFALDRLHLHPTEIAKRGAECGVGVIDADCRLSVPFQLMRSNLSAVAIAFHVGLYQLRAWASIGRFRSALRNERKNGIQTASAFEVDGRFQTSGIVKTKQRNT
jgi:hypothetical protein